MENIFTVNIIGSTDLDLERPMKTVVVRLSIVDYNTRELLRKSRKDENNANICVISAHEETEFIPPFCTKPVKIDNLLYLSPLWDDSFIFNEPITSILKENVYFFFEILDLSVPLNEHQITPIAWAFLRPKANEKDDNIGHPCVLQLHEYPRGFKTSLVGSKVPVADLLVTRRKIPATLTIEIDRSEGQHQYEFTGRPMHFFQTEVGKMDINKLTGKDIAPDVEERVEGEEVQGKRKRKVHVVRSANKLCKVPTILARQIPMPNLGVHTLTFNRNGDLLVAAVREDSGYSIYYYELENYSLIRKFSAHQEIIYELQFSFDDGLMLSASGDGMVKVWRGDGSGRYKNLLRGSKPVYSAKFHPQDDRLIFTSYENEILLWDRPHEQVLGRLTGNGERVNSLVLDPKGKFMYAGSSNGVITVFNTDLTEAGIDGISRRSIVKEDEIKGVSITSLSMEKSEYSVLVHTQDNMLRLFEAKVMIPSQRYAGAQCQKYQMRSCLSPDGKFVLAGSEDGTAVLWSSQHGTVIAVPEWKFRYEYPLTALAWNRVENMIAFSSFGDGQPILIFKHPDRGTYADEEKEEEDSSD